ncbi:MAG TPA: hypothetical protein DCM62_03630 [Bacteroidales bacterium]|nr:hypothetical protein [Bacteroidales bacterium]
MKESKNNIDSIAKDRFSDFEPVPPLKVWYNIVDELPYKPAPKNYTKVILMAAGLALLFSTTAWLYFVANRTHQIIESQNPAVSQSGTPIGSMPAITDKPNIQENAYPVLAKANTKTNLSKNKIARIPTAAIPNLAPKPITPSLPQLAERTISAPRTLTAQPSFIINAPSTILAEAFTEPQLNRSNRSQPAVRLSVGSHLAIQNNFRTLSYGPNHFANISFARLENEIITFDAGISVVVRGQSRFSFQTGLNYSTVGQFVNSIDIYEHPNLIPLFIQNPNSPLGHPQTVITSHGFIRLNENRMYFSDKEAQRVITTKRMAQNPLSLNLTNQGLTQVFGFVELPLIGRFLLHQRNWAIHVKGGVAANYLVSNQVFPGESLFNQSIGETYGIRKFNFEGVVGLVLELPIAPNLTLHLEPTAQYFFFPIINEFVHFGRAVPYSYSLFTGIRYNF